MAPVRIQLSRAKGWRMPANTVKVDRSTRWGNPWVSGDPAAVLLGPVHRPAAVCHLPMAITSAGAADRYRRWLRGEFQSAAGAMRMDHPVYEAVVCDERPDLATYLAPLRGKNLACWCKPGDPCHADVLLDLANPPPIQQESE